LKTGQRRDMAHNVNAAHLYLCIGAVLLAATNAHAADLSTGDATVLQKRYETRRTRSDGTPLASSSGVTRLSVRVIAVRADGRELVYDLPPGAPEAERARNWQFPARVFQPDRGTTTLLNQDELESRLAAWLTSANRDRSVCGQWIFTWNAFYIDCDPQSVLATIDGFDLRVADLGDKAVFVDKGASEPGRLAAAPQATGGRIYKTQLPVDPEVVHRARAESDVVVGAIMKQPVLLDAALEAHRKDRIEGTISVTLEADPSGAIRRRVRVVRLQTVRADGSTEIETQTETVERH
jgi:hypothetical protein